MDWFKIGLKTSYVATFLMLIVAANSYISPSNFTKYVESPKDTKIFSKAHTMGKTVNNNQLIIFTITKSPYQKLSQLAGRQAILIDSYMHAREPYSVELAFKLYENIVSNRMIPALSNFLETGLIIFYPFVNPDGYKQFVKANSQKQEIRKNFNKGNQQCQFGSAGVDINRNFDSSFGAVASSTSPCSEQYRGAAPFSQSQSKVFKEIFTMFKVIIAIDIHSYGNEWIYPYASDARQQKIKIKPLFGIYNEVIDRFRSSNFTIQSCFQSLGYIADGVYIDWALDQGAFSLAYEVGKNFNSDTGIAQQVKKSLQEFDTLFAFLEPKIVAFQKSTILQLHSKSIRPLNVKIAFDSSQQQGQINPGQSLLFNIPLNSSSVKIFIGKQQLLSSSLAQPPQLYESKLVVLSILIVLTLLYLLIYKSGKVSEPHLKKPSFSSRELRDEIQIRNNQTQQQ